MSQRWYIAPIVGSGTEADPYRAKVANSAGISGHTAHIPTDSAGVPVSAWALVLVNAADHSLLTSDPDLDVLPDQALDTVLTNSERALIRAALARRNVPRKVIDIALTYRDFLRALGRQFDDRFTEQGMSVG